MRTTNTSAEGQPENPANGERWKQQSSVTMGHNYYSPTKPYQKKLVIPTGGITTKEKEIEIAKLDKQKNAWELVGKRAEVETTMHNAHGKTYQAMGAAVTAGTELVKANTTWNNYQATVADNRVSRSNKNVSIQGIAIAVEGHQVELEKKKANLDKSKMELEQLLTSNAQTRLDITHDTVLAEIVGNSVDVKLPTFVSNLSGLLQPTEDIQFDG